MKKLLALLIVLSSLVACGSDKSNEKESEMAEPAKPADKYVVEMEAIYEKDDSLVVFYKIDGYYKYDKPVTQKIKASPVAQKIIFDIPEGVKSENMTIIASTNKDQAHAQISNISIKKNNVVIADGSNFKHSKYFVTDASFSWDDANKRFNLNHKNENPPAFSGNTELESVLSE